MATQKLILAKDLKCPKWSFAVTPIKKGTEVEAELHGQVYIVKHPEFMGLYIHADKSYFVDTRIKANIKVGDEFWFVSIYSFKIWSSKVSKITPKFAIFGEKNESYKISLFELNDVNMNSIEIRKKEGINNFAAIGDLVATSKNKLDIQKMLLGLIVKLKIDKEHAIENLAKEHTQKMEEYAKLESQEAELKKEINCNL